MAKEAKVTYNPTIHGEALRNCIETATDEMALIDGHKEVIKDIRKRVVEELGYSASKFNQMVKIRFANSRDKFEETKDEIMTDYDDLFGNKDE